MKPTIQLSGTAERIFTTLTTAIFEAAEQRSINAHIADIELLTSFSMELGIYFDCMEKVGLEGAVIGMVNGKQEMQVLSPYFKAARSAIGEARKILGCLSKQLRNVVAERYGEQLYGAWDNL